MNQIVYVVMDTELARIYGVYNAEADAIKVATSEWLNDDSVTITPVLVDARPISDNGNCETPSEVREEVNSIYEWMAADGNEVYDLDDDIETEDDSEDEEYESEDEDEEEDEYEYSEDEVQELLRRIFMNEY